MNLVPAPTRVLKQWSTWVLLAQGVLDLAVVAWHSLAAPDLHFITTDQAIVGNILLTFLAGALKFIQQNIALTEAQRVAIVEAALAAPAKQPPGGTPPVLVILLAALLVGMASSAMAEPWPCDPFFTGEPVGRWGFERTDDGRFTYHYCKHADGRITAHGIVCEHGKCLPVGSFAEKVDEIRGSPDRVAAAKAAIEQHFSGDLCKPPATEKLARICAAQGLKIEANRPKPPEPAASAPAPAPPASAPAPVYTHGVKPNGTSLSRPAYALVNGVRGTKEISRATVGADCDLTKPTLASGADVWASYAPAFEAGKVALCSKR
jgi:hypothetical protein